MYFSDMKKEVLVFLTMIFMWQLNAQNYELLLQGEYKDTVKINRELKWFGFQEKEDSTFLIEVKPEYNLTTEAFVLTTGEKLVNDLLIGTNSIDSLYKYKQEKVIWMEKFPPKEKLSWQENTGSFEHLESKGEVTENNELKGYELFYKFEVSIISRFSKNINPILLAEIHKITGENYTHLTEEPTVSVLHIDNKGSKDIIIEYRDTYFLLAIDCCIPEKHNVVLKAMTQDFRIK